MTLRSTCIFSGGLAGYLEEIPALDIEGEYTFMPVRSIHHLELSKAVLAQPTPVEITIEGHTHSMVAMKIGTRTITLRPNNDFTPEA